MTEWLGIPRIGDPAGHAWAITPNDSEDLEMICRAIYVGVAGDLKVKMLDGSVVTFVGAIAGNVYPIRVSQVFATGTTAGSLVGLR